MKRAIVTLLLLLALVFSAQAQETKSALADSRWYVGADVGVSFGSSTLKSFGMDKTRVGYGAGLMGGYQINSFLSTELEVNYRHLGLGAYDCYQNLWLGADGNRYFAPVTGMDNWQYSDLRSSISLYGLGVRLNVDFIKLFKPESRWSAMISPAIYGIGSSASVRTISSGDKVRNSSSFHFGVGGDLGVGYQVCKNINVRLYSGITYLTGKGIDAMPQVEHKSNNTWNSGVKVTFVIGKRKVKQATQPAYVAPASVVEVVKKEPKAEEKQVVAEVKQKEEQAIIIIEQDVPQKESIPEPIFECSILFGINNSAYREKSIPNHSKTIERTEGKS